MSESNNGQSLPKQGNYTGARLARERPRIYREVMRLLSEGTSARKICRTCHVTRETVRAVERREAESISARKQELAVIAARVAQASIEQIEDDVAAGKIKGAQLVPVFGVCVDKLQALSGDHALRIAFDHQHQHIHAHIRDDRPLSEIISLLPSNQPLPQLPHQGDQTHEDNQGNDSTGA
jgi:hypothetical protein